MEMQEFIDKYLLTISFKEVSWEDEDREPWTDTAKIYRAKIKSPILPGKYKTIWCSGSDIGGPTVESVLECIHCDWVDESFEFFCDSYGWDKDSIKAFKTYNLCLEQTAKAQKYFGPALDALLSIEM